MWNTEDCWGRPATWYSKEEVQKYINTLKEVRILATKDVSFESFVKIQNKINEVLSNEEQKT